MSRFSFALGLATLLVVLSAVYGVRTATGYTLLWNHKCEQRGVCWWVQIGDCEVHSTNCENRTCAAQCPGVSALVCVPKQGESCKLTDYNACDPDAPVPRCVYLRGKCVCDEENPVGYMDCPNVYRCIL